MSSLGSLSRQQLVALDRKHIWRPYTSSEDHQSTNPLVIASAQGPWLVDVDGCRYLDGNGSWWVNTLGHSHPRLLKAIEEQMAHLAHCSLAGTTHEAAARLAKELVDVAPEGMTRVFFTDDGSTAVEVAMKIAFQYWQQNGRPERTRFVALAGAFHGDTLGATALGGVEAFRAKFAPVLMDVIHSPDPQQIGGWEKVMDSIDETLSDQADTIAGVVVEPMLQGAAGMRLWPADQLARLREMTRRVDTWLIADEVFAGYGRTGRMWACEHAGVVPDLLCVAKAFSGGVLPMAATLATGRVYDGFRGGKDRALMHGHSFCGNPLGAAVAREVLAIYRDEDIVEQVQNKSPQIEKAFERIAQLPGVLRTRSLGMVGAADLGSGGYSGQAGWKVYQHALQRGAYLRPLGDTVYVTPPLTISEGDLEQLLSILHDSIQQLTSSS